MVVELITRRDLDEARDLLAACELDFDPDYDNLLGIYDGQRLAAVGGRAGYLLKMIAIAEQDRNGTLLDELLTELIRLGCQAGYDSFAVVTKPTNIPAFSSYNFNLLAQHPQAVLMEYGGGLHHYLHDHRHLVREGHNGAVVVNCNPFTWGHRYLIETAASQVDWLYVFVVREDRSVFPFDVRYRLVKDGVADLDNVLLLDSSHYAISALTFPTYFLRDVDIRAEVQMTLDLELFATRLAPFFNISKRFFGTEPYCRTTRNYSAMMAELLPQWGIEGIEITRRQVDEEVISAYRVRQAMRREAYEEVRRLVPPTTLDYLLSAEGEPLRKKLQNFTGRH